MAEIKEHVADRRAKLVDGVTNSLTKYEDSLPAIEYKGIEPRQELYEIEKEVVAELWDELIREPALSAFDEKLGAALR